MTKAEAKKIAEAIWDDLNDRRGFGLGSLKWDDRRAYRGIIASWAKLILAGDGGRPCRCGARREEIVDLGDETFAPRVGCLTCNKWDSPKVIR